MYNHYENDCEETADRLYSQLGFVGAYDIMCLNYHSSTVRNFIMTGNN